MTQLRPEEAAAELERRGVKGMDDPLAASYPLRWWWGESGFLFCAWWRGPSMQFDIQRNDKTPTQRNT